MLKKRGVVRGWGCETRRWVTREGRGVRALCCLGDRPGFWGKVERREWVPKMIVG